MSRKRVRSSEDTFVHNVEKGATPEHFWTEFVSKRLPAKFDSMIEDTEWKGQKWSNAYLRAKCKETVRVEMREQGVRGFGRGNETTMAFSEFIRRLEDDGDFQYYLTTQELTHDEEGRPSLTSAPVQQLEGDFPWRPKIMGNLVLQNANLWFGSSSVPTSSGLHHDFHDNLYILLRGRKTITLYAPTDCARMYTHGTVRLVYPNGRINYEGEPVTNADGSHASAEEMIAASRRLEGLGMELEQDIGKEKNGSRTRTESEIEAEIQREMELILDAEMGGEHDDEGKDDDDDDDDDDEEEGEERSSDTATTTTAISATSTSKQPPNFSRVDTSLSVGEIHQEFPRFPDKPYAIVELTAGQMLYLPAGWFHEVHSSGGGSEGHMAFNYWFHPPDGDSFDQPYTSNFWRRDWEARGMPW